MGSLAPGKIADLVVLDHDLRTTADDDLREVDAHCTVLAGEVVYQA